MIVELVISDDKVNYYTVVYLPHIQALKCHKCIPGGVSKPLSLDRYLIAEASQGYPATYNHNVMIFIFLLSLNPRGLTRAGPENRLQIRLLPIVPLYNKAFYL